MLLTADQAAKKIRDQADKAFRLLVLEAGKRIVYKTPVKTGRAKGNWQVSVGAPSAPEREPDKGGMRTILDMQGKAANLDIDDVAYIVNGVEYVEHLEKGTDKIPAFGMIAVTIEELKAKTAEVAAIIRRAQ